MTTTFDGGSWKKGADAMDSARQDWDDASEPVVMMAELTGGPSIVDEAVVKHAETLRLEWFDLVGNVSAALSSDSSKMRSTGTHYSNSEDDSVEANDRFWGERS